MRALGERKGVQRWNPVWKEGVVCGGGWRCDEERRRRVVRLERREESSGGGWGGVHRSVGW